MVSLTALMSIFVGAWVEVMGTNGTWSDGDHDGVVDWNGYGNWNGSRERGTTELLQRFERIYPVDEWSSAGYFTRDYLAIINPHWLRFEPRPPAQHYALAMLFVVIMFIGILGNFLVIFLFARCKALRTPANILVVNLACSDLLMMLKMPIFIFNSRHLGPALGDKVCRLYGFVGGLSGTCSICTITAISMDRFLVVKYPLKNRFPSHRAKLCVVLSWLYAGSFSIVPLLDFGYGRYVPEGFLTSCSFDYLTDNTAAKGFIWMFAVTAFVIPIALIAYFYMSILRIVVQKTPDAGKQNLTGRESQRHMRLEDKRKQELRITAVVFSVIVVWFLAWTPYAVVALLGISGMRDAITPLGSMIPALFCKSAACCDPFIYALTHPKFKGELRKLCCRNARVRRTFTDRTHTHNASSHEMTTRVSETTTADALDNVTGNKRRFWWCKPGFNNRANNYCLKALSRRFSQQRPSSSHSLHRAHHGDDGVEEIVLGNLQVHEDYM